MISHWHCSLKYILLPTFIFTSTVYYNNNFPSLTNKP